MPDNLGQVIQCVSHVSTRLRYVLKLMVTSGSPTEVEVLLIQEELRQSVKNVSIKLNAPNGASTMSNTEFGAGFPRFKESLYEESVT